MTSPIDPQTKVYTHINGQQNDLFDRLAISELCKGWPVYRDASEWKNFRSLFCDDAYVWTTWSKRQSIDNFIQVSKAGKANGDFIMHRECGTLVDLNPSTGRAVGKMKATITQRFIIEGDATKGIEPVVFDIDCDCRFHFFCFQEPHSTAWKVKYVKLIYDKDKVLPVDGKNVPSFSREALERYPEGYRYLGAAQKMLGHEIDEFLPTIQGQESGPAHRLWIDIYEKMGQWLSGQEDVDLSSVVHNGFANGKAHRNGNGHQNGFGH
ncbi:Uu.00g079040.m01.CDS01 [Anthostomella pinea]|uniref:Uu.00g079040.m01.CDS01 n=1 Tax=Anthostomella pinea TaxID=933095 RepID=A0AAI8VKT5_9PEZI|nr:Uu.00g079040.m01.CDS01 [Anthostomella pinea]